MQKQLGFQRISADTAQKQRDHIATKWMEEHPLFPASDPAPQPKRKPGRPPKLPQKLAASPDPAPPAKKARTGHYTNWFSSPYINDVLQALERHSYNFKHAGRQPSGLRGAWSGGGGRDGKGEGPLASGGNPQSTVRSRNFVQVPKLLHEKMNAAHARLQNSNSLSKRSGLRQLIKALWPLAIN